MPTFTSQRDHARRSAASSSAACHLAVRKAASLTPVQLLTGGGSGSQLEGQSRQQMSNAKEQIAHFRGQSYTSINPIATRIAGQPFRMARIAKSIRGKQNRAVESRSYPRREIETLLTKMGVGIKANENIELVDQSPVLDALSQPWQDNPSYLDWHLRYNSVVSMKLTGLSYLWTPVTKGKRQIICMPPNWVRPIASGTALFDSFALKVQGQSDEKIVPGKEIAFAYYPDPTDPTAGYGPFQAGYNSVVVNEYIEEAAKRAFQEGIFPSKVFYVALGADKTGRPIMRRLAQWQINQTRDAIMNRHRGVSNFGGPLFVDASISKIEDYTRKPNEMDFGGNADKAQAKVEQIFGTNPYIAGAAGLGSRAEAAEADAHFCNQTVNPTIELLSRVLTVVLLPRFDNSGQYVLFIEPARPRDSQMEFQEWQLALQRGICTVNEYRTHVLRQPPTPWGDAVWTPMDGSLLPVSSMASGYARPIGAGSVPTSIGADLGQGKNKPGDAGSVVDPAIEAEEVAEGQEPENEAETGKAYRVTF